MTTHPESNTRYILFMIVAMAGFAVEDAIIKKLAVDMPVSQVLMLIGLTGSVMFGVLATARSVKLFDPAMKQPKFLWRNLCEFGAAITFVTAIVYASLSASSAILQATPILVVLGGVVFLNQPVKVRQWVWIVLGFMGVLLIIQPGTDAFDPPTLLAVAAAFILATRDLLMRSIAGSIDPLAISFWAFFALIFSGVFTIPLFGEFAPISLYHAGLLSLSMLTGGGAYMAVVMATRGGDLAVVAPFRYSRLVFAMLLGALLFDEAVTWPIIAGSALVVVSGIFALRDGR